MMHDIISLFCSVLDDIENCGISVGNIIDINTSKRYKSRLGNCHRKWNHAKDNYDYTITLNYDYMMADLSGDGIKSTIAHEILHTVPGCFNHGTQWKEIADRLMAKYPTYKISRLTDASEYGYTRKIEYKYTYQCECCGYKVNRQRKSNFTSRYVCGHCGGNFLQVMAFDSFADYVNNR